MNLKFIQRMNVDEIEKKKKEKAAQLREKKL